MQVSNVNIQTTNFKSNFIPNALLEKTFKRAARDNDRIFIKSVKAILNDGKNDTLELKQRDQFSLSLYVNDEIADGRSISLNYYCNEGTELINRYAKKFGINVHNGKYGNLSKQETELIKEDIDVIKMLSENIENCTNYIEEIQKLTRNIQQKIDQNAKNELNELKKTIFGR